MTENQNQVYMPADIREDAKFLGIIPVQSLLYLVPAGLSTIFFTWIFSYVSWILVVLVLLIHLMFGVFLVAQGPRYIKRYREFKKIGKVIEIDDLWDIERIEDTTLFFKDGSMGTMLLVEPGPWELRTLDVKSYAGRAFANALRRVNLEKGEVMIVADNGPEDKRTVERKRREYQSRFTEGDKLREFGERRVNYHLTMNTRKTVYRVLLKIKSWDSLEQSQEKLDVITNGFQTELEATGARVLPIAAAAISDIAQKQLTPWGERVLFESMRQPAWVKSLVRLGNLVFEKRSTSKKRRALPKHKKTESVNILTHGTRKKVGR